MFVKPEEKKMIKKAKSRIIVAIEAKIRYLNEASAFTAILRFIISVKESIENSSRQRKKRIKSEEATKRIPDIKVRKIISINS